VDLADQLQRPLWLYYAEVALTVIRVCSSSATTYPRAYVSNAPKLSTHFAAWKGRLCINMVARYVCKLYVF